ncbi:MULTISPECIES: hypothetical protein [unclassified Curtobacterium]|jgi:hypothetical protein|uniref:hypothetical protein n=1 Tax=unclassified Curtobacterium TaxID=257496 RepID=UPI0021D79270|nr:hypothetical protein [Curtobacterium sp. RIT-PI-V]
MTRTPFTRRPDRPQVVTVSIVLWLLWVAVCLVATVLQFVAGADGNALGTVLTVLVAVAVWGLVGWAVVRTATGSRVARIVLVVVAVARAVLSITSGEVGLLTIALSVVAAVLLFLPSARPFFARSDAGRTDHGFSGPGVSGSSRASWPDPDHPTDADRT